MKQKLRDLLIAAAEKGETLYYSQIYEKLSLSSMSSGGKTELHRMLATIGNDEVMAGRPPLNCIVIRRFEGDPGGGFFLWYRRVVDRTLDIYSHIQRRELFEKLKEEVFEFWANESELV